MSTIVLRATKGSPLTNNEIDSNFSNLNTDKLQTDSLSVTTTAAGTAGLAYASNVFTYTPPNLSGYAALSGATFTGAIATNSTVDGRDVATDGTKLDGIEASADVTDTDNVTSSGALMDSEVTNLAQVKAFASSDYATAAQGTTADSALQTGDKVAVGIASVVTSSSLTATVNTHVYVSAATQTITLPASPSIGQRVLITVGNFVDTVVGRNSSNIMSSGTDMTLDKAYLSIQFIYTDATQGWVMS
tara:strand:- start:1379 stop:2116 length:738 start_codon:yes stop_codon:yes gene_type:complete